MAVAAVDVRLDAAAFAGADAIDAVADRQHLDAQFVTWDARVAKQRHLALVGADVGAAHADAVDAHQGLAAAGRGGAGSLRRWVARAVKSALRRARWTFPQVSRDSSVSDQPRRSSSAIRWG